MIKAVLFDVDGVLVDSFDANLKFYQELLEKAGYSAPTKKQFSPLMHQTMFSVIKILTHLEDADVQKIWEMGNRRDVPYRENLMTSPEGLEKTIKILNKVYRLGVVTARVKNGMFAFPKGKNLKKYFSAAVCYEDTTKHKPDPEPLFFAAKQLDVHPDEVVYIGDLESDIQAARAAGMKVIIFSKDPYPAADACTSSLSELPALIKKIL